MHRFPMAALTAALLWPLQAAAQELVLTLPEALALARERAPLAVAARARVDEARGRLTGASVWLRENPQLELGAGQRHTPEGARSAEARLELRQSLELGGQRGARVAAAEAAVARAEAGAGDVLRRVLRDVALAFLRLRHAEERSRLAGATVEVAASVLATSERRLQTGDVPRVDVALARATLSRARADVSAEEARREAALGELRGLLGLSAGVRLSVGGELGDRQRPSLPELLAGAAERPDLRALEAELREARAERRLGSAQRWPSLGLGASYERDEGSDVGLGLVSLTLPLFERGQGLRAEAGAREIRVAAELEAARKAVEAEVRSAFAVHGHRLAAAEELERNALPLLEENEALIRRSYESGLIGLPDFLAVRREILGTRLEYLERLFEAASAKVELEASAGLLR